MEEQILFTESTWCKLCRKLNEPSQVLENDPNKKLRFSEQFSSSAICDKYPEKYAMFEKQIKEAEIKEASEIKRTKH